MLRHSFTLFVYLGTVFATEIPDFLHVCPRNHPQMNECIIQAVEDLRPHMINGEPKYNIPSLEPLILSELFSDNAAGLKISTKNVSAWGCSGFTIKKLDTNIDTHVIEADIEIPHLNFVAQYDVVGKLLMLPVKESGSIEANLTEITSHCTIIGELYEKNGEQYLRYTKVTLDTQVGPGSVRLDKLFKGDNALLKLVNDSINKNLPTFVKEILPTVEKALQEKFLEISNAIVEQFTFDQLFPK